MKIVSYVRYDQKTKASQQLKKKDKISENI